MIGVLYTYGGLVSICLLLFGRIAYYLVKDAEGRPLRVYSYAIAGALLWPLTAIFIVGFLAGSFAHMGKDPK